MKDKTGLNMLSPIISVSYLDDYVLRVVWTDGLEGDVDLKSHVHAFAVAGPLRDLERFRLAKPGEGGFTIDFGDDLEIPCDLLRRVVLENQGRIMPVEAFNQWKQRNGLSLSKAALALGLTRRTIAAYASGERPIPRTVMLACKGWEALRDEANKAA